MAKDLVLPALLIKATAEVFKASGTRSQSRTGVIALKTYLIALSLSQLILSWRSVYLWILDETVPWMSFPASEALCGLFELYRCSLSSCSRECQGKPSKGTDILFHWTPQWARHCYIRSHMAQPPSHWIPSWERQDYIKAKHLKEGQGNGPLTACLFLHVRAAHSCIPPWMALQRRARKKQGMPVQRFN